MPQHHTSLGGTVRHPRRGESIQAYSMNGSPLGVLPAPTLVPSTMPTGDFTFQMSMESLASSTLLSYILLLLSSRFALQA